MRLVAAVVVIAIASTGTARADQPIADEKSPITAFALSAGSTAIGVGLFAIDADMGPGAGRDAIGWGASAFVALGPTAGHWYAGHASNPGLIVRGAGTIVMIIGAAGAITACEDGPHGLFDRCRATLDVGLGIVAVGTVWEIATAPLAARDWNRDHRFVIAPTALPAAGGPAPGIAIGGTF